jgi:dCMP deaminase
MKNRDEFYMKIAELCAENSYAERNKVGAVLVKDNNILAFGYNGTPHGFDNKCEDEQGMTKPEVIHAEVNIFAKTSRLGIATNDSVLYVTLSPCFDCSKLLLQAGIKEVVYRDEYRVTESLEMLRSAGVKCRRLLQ